MTQNRYILTWLLAAVTALGCLLVSCGDSGDIRQMPAQEIVGEPLTVSALTRGTRDANDILSEGLTIWIMAVPTDQSGVQAGVVSYNGPVEGSSDISWNSAIYVKNDKTYEMYGIIPFDAAETITTTSSNYQQTKLSLQNLKSLSDKDVCVLTGAIIACNDSLSPTDYLARGSYYYHPIFPDVEGSDNQRYGVRLLADHLYASVKFNVYVNSDYNVRRTIKLTKMELTTKPEMTTVNTSITLDKTLRGTTTPFAFDGTPTNTGKETDLPSVVLFDDDEGQEIKTESAYSDMTAEDKANYITINPGYFGSWVCNDLYLVSTYDVYDKKGNLTRKGCTAKNRLTSKLVRTDPDTGTEEPIKAGERVTITLTVNPTYLYVLSDQELDNPTIVVGGE
jgi:hypothetical protein